MIINADVGILLVKQETIWKVSQKKKKEANELELGEYDMSQRCAYENMTCLKNVLMFPFTTLF